MLKIGALANIRLYCFWKQTYFSCVCGVHVCVHTQVCMHVHVCAYTLIWVHAHLFMCMWSLKLARGVLSSSLRQGISAEARVCNYSWSAGQLPQRSSPRSAGVSGGHHSHLPFTGVLGDLNSGPHAWCMCGKHFKQCAISPARTYFFYEQMAT